MPRPGSHAGTGRPFRRPVLVTLGLLAAAGCIATTFEYRLTGQEQTLNAARLAKKPVLWKLPLGPALIEEMRLVAPDRLLVGLKKDDIKISNLDWLLVDTATGNPLWRHRREGGEADYSLVVAMENLFLFRVDRGGQASLLALDGVRGTTLWSAKLGTGLADLIPLFEDEIVVAVEHGKSATRLAAYRWRNGASAWTAERPAPPDAASKPHPQEAKGDIFLFTGGVARISGKSGRDVWTRDDIRLTPDAPPPQSDAEILYIADAGGTLHSLDPATGKSVRTGPVPESLSTVTSIVPVRDRLYLRGEARDKSGGAGHGLAAVRTRDGAHLWTYRSASPTVSDIVEENGRVLAGSATRIVVLDGKTGKLINWDDVTTTGKTFPVRLARAGGHVVFISEMMIAAYDPATGRQVYSHGMDPISQMTSLNGLDVSIRRLEAELKISQAESQNRMNRFQADAAMANQRQAAARQAREQRNIQWNRLRENIRQGKSGGEFAINQMGILTAGERTAQTIERTMSMVDFQLSMMELSIAMQNAWREQGLRSDLTRQKFYRRTILAANNASMEDDYVYRPHHPSSLMGIKIVHLPTGRADYMDLSPAYLDYGIWNLVDFRKGVVYHHGIGMDAADYIYCDPFPKKPLLDGKQYKSYLIAQPIALRK